MLLAVAACSGSTNKVGFSEMMMAFLPLKRDESLASVCPAAHSTTGLVTTHRVPVLGFVHA